MRGGDPAAACDAGTREAARRAAWFMPPVLPAGSRLKKKCASARRGNAMNTYTKHPDGSRGSGGGDLNNWPKPDFKKFADERRPLVEPDLKDLGNLAFAAGKRAKTPTLDREATVSSVLAEWEGTRRELPSQEIEAAELRRALFACPGLRGLAEAAFDAGVRNEARAANPHHEAIFAKLAQIAPQTVAKRSMSPIDLANRALEIQEADPELSNIESVKAAYAEAGVPLQ